MGYELSNLEKGVREEVQFVINSYYDELVGQDIEHLINKVTAKMLDDEYVWEVFNQAIGEYIDLLLKEEKHD